MPESVIYKHPSVDCPLCKLVKGKKGSETLTHRCLSMAVYASNYHDSMWVLRCEENYKKCPGFRYHNRALKAFKFALARVSHKVKAGRVVSMTKLAKAIKVPEINLNTMERQEYSTSIRLNRLVDGCLDKYGFEKIEKTKKNKKMKIWKIDSEWFVRRVS